MFFQRYIYSLYVLQWLNVCCNNLSTHLDTDVVHSSILVLLQETINWTFLTEWIKQL